MPQEPVDPSSEVPPREPGPSADAPAPVQDDEPREPLSPVDPVPPHEPGDVPDSPHESAPEEPAPVDEPHESVEETPDGRSSTPTTTDDGHGPDSPHDPAPPDASPQSIALPAYPSPYGTAPHDDLWPVSTESDGPRDVPFLRLLWFLFPRPLPTVDPMAGEDPGQSTKDRLTRRLLGGSLALARLTQRQRLMGWVWPLAVTLLGGVLRFVRLDQPHELVFDETYYVKEGYSMTARGYEADWGVDPNPGFEAGDTSMLSPDRPERVVHPLVGKWLIGLGMRLTGGVDSSFAWRFAVALAGTLAILMVARIGRRLFGSTALGTLAGLFLAVDGMGIVMSRTSVLDGFLMVFALGAFGLLLLDRDQSRRRLAERVAAIVDTGGTVPDLGPRLGVRWWRLGAAVLLGLACGVKWSGVYFLLVFWLMSVAWDVTARYRVGVRRFFASALLDGVVGGVAMAALTAATYVATWTSWFVSDHADYRQWAAQHPGQGQMWLPPVLRSWWQWHVDTWTFHNGLETPHPYAAGPAGWIIQLRPTSFYYSTDVSGLHGQAAKDVCGADACARAVTSLGNPLIWWLGAAAVIVALVWLVWFRDWRAGAVLSGLAGGWLPWLGYAHRTIFTFYAVAFLPWVVLTLTYVIGLVIGSKDDVAPHTRKVTIGVVGVVVALIVAVSAFFYPIWTAWTIPYDQWHVRMWLRTWV